MRVKGTLLLDYIKMVRANKDGPWDDYLTPEDWEIINGQILSSQWYPYESFRRIAFAAFKIIAKSDLNTSRAFGRFTLKNLLKVYKTIVQPGDPVGSAKKLAALRRTFVEGDIDTRVGEHGDDWLVYKFTYPVGEDDQEHFEAFTHQMAGNLEELVEQAGGRNVVIDMEIGKESSSIHVKWE